MSTFEIKSPGDGQLDAHVGDRIVAIADDATKDRWSTECTAIIHLLAARISTWHTPDTEGK